MKKMVRKAIALMCMAAMVVSSGTGTFAADSKNLEDRTYTASVYNNSQMMNVNAADNNTCTVTVKEGKATAHVRLNGDGYSKLFIGTSQEASANKDEAKFIMPEEYEKGKYAYDIPVEKFGEVMNIAALGTKWYNRKFVFYLDTPGKPEIKEIRKSPRAIEVKWDKKPSFATSYRLYVSTTGNVDEPDEWSYTEVTSNQGIIKDLDPGETVYTRVAAVINPFNESPVAKNIIYSDVQKVKLPAAVAKTAVKSVTSPAKKTLKITWTKKSADVTGYQIMYSTDSKFKNAKTVTVSKNTATTYKKTNLKSGKKYYVKARTYQKIGAEKYTSAWSAAKSVKIR